MIAMTNDVYQDSTLMYSNSFRTASDAFEPFSECFGSSSYHVELVSDCVQTFSENFQIDLDSYLNHC